jgi:hypothetical protein
MLLVLPVVAGFVAFRLCKELQKRDGQDPVDEPEPAVAPADEAGAQVPVG